MTEIGRPPIVIVPRCIILNDCNELLLLRRSAQESSFAGKWEFPGGKWDYGPVDNRLPEGLKGARDRELSEEIGCKIKLLSPLAYPVDRIIEEGKYQGVPHLSLFYLGRLASDNGVMLSKEHDRQAWVPNDEVLDHQLTQASAAGFLGLRPLLMSTVIGAN
jgi:8-oxo-dGTP diphosphatase